jgi:hypothetical protein
MSIVRKKTKIKTAAFLLALFYSLTGSAVFEPVEYTGFLKIPGVGFQSFYRFEDEDNSIQQMPFPSGSAYIRWMWKQVEPQEGEYNWNLIDNSLARARENGQTLEFRIMLEMTDQHAIPQWLIDKGVSLRYTTCEGEHYSPDLEDPILREYHYNLIRALGERYDGHPDLGSVDIGSVGLWGEWHIYCDPDLMPSREERLAIIDLYYEVFPNTPLTALVDDKESVVYAADKGRSAWRADCWGNYLPTNSWSHHQNSYRPMHEMIPEAWKKGPVAMESCGTMRSWDAPDDVITEIIDETLFWHTSMAHNKSDNIPSEFQAEVERLVMNLGFRLVLRTATYNDAVPPGSSPLIAMDWENLGVAPPYRDHRIAFRLNDGQGNYSAVVITEQSIRGWLPGDTSVNVRYSLPDNVSEGEYTLETGLVFHSAPDRTVPIAIEGETADGWYPLGAISVDRNAPVYQDRHKTWHDMLPFNIACQNSITEFQFLQEHVKHATVAIYSLDGDEIISFPITDSKQYWNGADHAGRRAEPGAYIAYLRNGKFTAGRIFFLPE